MMTQPAIAFREFGWVTVFLWLDGEPMMSESPDIMGHPSSVIYGTRTFWLLRFQARGPTRRKPQLTAVPKREGRIADHGMKRGNTVPAKAEVIAI